MSSQATQRKLTDAQTQQAQTKTRIQCRDGSEGETLDYPSSFPTQVGPYRKITEDRFPTTTLARVVYQQPSGETVRVKFSAGANQGGVTQIASNLQGRFGTQKMHSSVGAAWEYAVEVMESRLDLPCSVNEWTLTSNLDTKWSWEADPTTIGGTYINVTSEKTTVPLSETPFGIYKNGALTGTHITTVTGREEAREAVVDWLRANSPNSV